MITVLSIGTLIDMKEQVVGYKPQELYLNNSQTVCIPSCTIEGQSLDESERQVIDMIVKYFRELRKEHAAV